VTPAFSAQVCHGANLCSFWGERFGSFWCRACHVLRRQGCSADKPLGGIVAIYKGPTELFNPCLQKGTNEATTLRPLADGGYQ
jgi:hypothetical protein